MRRVANGLLFLLQWLLIAFGLFLVLVAVNTYAMESRYFASLPRAAPGQDSYTPPIMHRLLTGITTGLIGMGLGAVLFYLRRLYLARRSSRGSRRHSE